MIRERLDASGERSESPVEPDAAYILAHPIRLKMVEVLLKGGSKGADAIGKEVSEDMGLDVPDDLVDFHLSTLIQRGLVRSSFVSHGSEFEELFEATGVVQDAIRLLEPLKK